MVDVTQPLEHMGDVTQAVIQPAVTGADMLRQLEAQNAAKGNPLGEAAKAIGAISGAIQGLAGGLDGAGSDAAREQGLSAGMQSVTRDENGNLQVNPITSSLFGKSGEVYTHAATAGAKAMAELQANQDINKLRLGHIGDPEGFKQATQDYLTGLGPRLHAAGPEILLGANQEASRNYDDLVTKKAAQDIVNGKAAIETGITNDTNDLNDLARKGGMSDDPNSAFMQTYGKMAQKYQTLQTNPAFGYPADRVQSELHDKMVQFHGEEISGSVDSAYKEGGEAAAQKVLHERSDALQGMTDADRQRVISRGTARVLYLKEQDAGDITANRAQLESVQALGVQAPPKIVQSVIDNATRLWDVETAGRASALQLYNQAHPPGVSPAQGAALQGVGWSASAVHSAIIGQESGGNRNAPTSAAVAQGIGQLQPGTFEQYAKPGEKISNPADNLAVSRRATDDYFARYHGDAQRVAVAYFSGPGNVAPPGSATPWISNKADATGKTVSSYVADITGRLGAAAGGAPAFRANNAHISPEWGNPDNPNFKSQYLTPIQVPGTGKTLDVHKNSAAAFEGFLGDLKAAGYPLEDVQSFNNRDIRGGSIKSQHAWGNAIDINPEKQPLGSHGSDFAKYGIDAHALAAKWGLMWGGDFIRRKDPMHFENARPIGGGTQPPMVASANGVPFTSEQMQSNPYLGSEWVRAQAQDQGNRDKVATSVLGAIDRGLDNHVMPSAENLALGLNSAAGTKNEAIQDKVSQIEGKIIGHEAAVGGSATGGQGGAEAGGLIDQARAMANNSADLVQQRVGQAALDSYNTGVKALKERPFETATAMKLPGAFVPPPINYADPQSVSQGIAARVGLVSHIAAAQPGFSPSAFPKSDKDALKVASASGDPRQQMGVVLGLGSIPPGQVRDATFADSDVRGAILAAAHSGNPAVMTQAYSLLDRQYRSNPMTFDEIYGKGTLAEMRGWQDKTSREPPAKVAEEIMKPLDSGTVAAREATDRAADVNLKLITNDSIVKQLAGSWRAGPYAPASDSPAELLGRMRADYEEAYKQSFAKFADDSAAQKYAVEATTGIRDGIDTGGGKWGLSAANGGRLMPYPPERSPAYPPVNGSQDWIKQQADEAVAQAYNAQPREKEQIAPPGVSVAEALLGKTAPPYALVSDQRTESEMHSGRPPSYRIAVQDKDGRLSMLPGTRFVGDPRATAAALPEDRHRFPLTAIPTMSMVAR